MSDLVYSVEHIGLASSDPAALKDWYVSVLDAEVIFDNGKLPPCYFIKLGDGTILELYRSSYEIKETMDNACRGLRHLALRVNSLDEAREILRSRGVIFSERIKPAGGGGVVLFFQDPEGNLIHLVERTPDSAVN